MTCKEEKSIKCVNYIYFHEKNFSNIHVVIETSVEVRESPGAQLGLFAAKDYKVGDLVLAETPNMIVTTFASSLVEAEEVLESEYQSFTDNQKKIFWSFGDKYTLPHPDTSLVASKEKSIRGIVETNGLPCGDVSEGVTPKTSGIYPLMCRVNHSCVPNVHHQYNSITKKETIYAIQPIHMGDELLTSYFDVGGMSFEKRQQMQVSKWNFACQCCRCERESKDSHYRQQNDKIEESLLKLDSEISFFSNFNVKMALEKCKMRLAILNNHQEDYDPVEFIRTEFDMFQLCMRSPETFILAKKLIRRILCRSIQVRGTSHPQTQKFADICRDPIEYISTLEAVQLEVNDLEEIRTLMRQDRFVEQKIDSFSEIEVCV